MKVTIVISMLFSLLPCFLAQWRVPYDFPQNSNIPGISAFPYDDQSSNGASPPNYLPPFYQQPLPASQYPSNKPQPKPQQFNSFQSNPFSFSGSSMNIYSIIDMLQKGLRPQNAYRVPPNYKLTGEGHGQQCHPNKGPRCSGFLMTCKCKTCPSNRPCYHHCC